MNKITLGSLVMLTLLVFGILSCKKNSNNNVVIPPFTSVVLTASHVSDSVVTLTWSKPPNDSPVSYILRKVVDSTSSMSLYQYEEIILGSNTSYTDTIPVTPYVQYFIQASVGKRAITSNTQTVARADLNFVYFVPEDVLYDNLSKKLYIYNMTDGVIALYDLQTNTVVKQIALGSEICNCSLGSYNGITELYVPQKYGRLLIYNAATLEKIDEIHGDWISFTVVSNNEQLFVSPEYATNSVIIYSRATKQKLDSVDLMYSPRLKLMPGTTSKFYAVDYSNAFYFNFNSAGHLIQTKAGLTGEVSRSLFEIFPDNSKLITSVHGTILDGNLNLQANLSTGNDQFLSFTFDAASNLIYGACRDKKKIKTYHMNSYSLQDKVVLTKGYPQKIFFDNGKLIVISLSDEIPNSKYSLRCCFVEQF